MSIDNLHNKKWKPKEVSDMLAAIKEGLTIPEISEMLGRSEHAIKCRAWKYGYAVRKDKLWKAGDPNIPACERPRGRHPEPEPEPEPEPVLLFDEPPFTERPAPNVPANVPLTLSCLALAVSVVALVVALLP